VNTADPVPGKLTGVAKQLRASESHRMEFIGWLGYGGDAAPAWATHRPWFDAPGPNGQLIYRVVTRVEKRRR